ncbi:trimethylamine methyltransferase family protein, partial [Blautia pseudococcoides]|nr:trimethylamine methyltransferase family protein [Blautia pseudococcoides]
HSFGEMDGLNVFSFEKYVLDEQIMAARKSVESIDIFSEEDMDLETISEVGPGGNYLVEEETILRYRTEIYYPELYSLENYADWERNGRVSVEQKAKERVEKRLREYTPPKFTAKQRAVLEKALEGFDL